jgi:hypothetical protein
MHGAIQGEEPQTLTVSCTGTRGPIWLVEHSYRCPCLLLHSWDLLPCCVLHDVKIISSVGGKGCMVQSGECSPGLRQYRVPGPEACISI